MQDSPTPIDRFFEEYARDTASGDIAAIVSHFGETFMAAGPDGARAVRAADFALAVPRRKQLFDKIGCKSTSLAKLETTPLDGRFNLARTSWRMTFAPADRDPQELVADSVFLVDTVCDPMKIILYLANQDIMGVLRERGLLTE